MRHFKRSAIAMAIVAIFAIGFSCSDQSVRPSDSSDAISDEVLTQFKNLGFDVSDIRMILHGDPIAGQAVKKSYLLEGDIVISEDNFQEMIQSELHHVGAVGEQYRTTNLVSGNPRTIRVLGYTGGTNALSSKMRTALQMAVDNYNALNIGLSFTLAFGTSTGSYDIVVYRVSGAAGGVAGFPSGGNPYKWVQIYSGTDSYSTDVAEHVITHEIGHTLGLRHTDYFNRSLSCGQGGNEGASDVGAIHVPGTPTGFDAGSIMLACFSSSASGEFGNYDRVALEYLY